MSGGLSFVLDRDRVELLRSNSMKNCIRGRAETIGETPLFEDEDDDEDENEGELHREHDLRAIPYGRPTFIPPPMSGNRRRFA